MKRLFPVITALFILVSAISGCGFAPRADFADAKAVVDAYLSDHTLEGDGYSDICTELAGKTVSVKTNVKNEPIAVVYEKVTLYTGIYVTVYGEDHGEVTDLDYSEGDTLVLEITEVAVRAYNDGQYRDFFINVKLPA